MLSVTVTSVLVFLVVVGMAIKARRRPVVSGSEQLIGSTGIARQDFTHQGTVSTHSETWQAITRTPIHKGQTVRITGIDGLTLEVEPIEEDMT